MRRYLNIPLLCVIRQYNPDVSKEQAAVTFKDQQGLEELKLEDEHNTFLQTVGTGLLLTLAEEMLSYFTAKALNLAHIRLLT